MKNITLTEIKKEDISILKFPYLDVLDNGIDRMNRAKELQKALTLGNLFHSKVRIYFIDNISPKKVETTVWSVTEKYVILKANTYLPIHRITEIQMY